MTPWWTDQQAGLWGGILGTAIGVLGGIFGTLVGICAPKGKCKRAVYALTAFLVAAGVMLLIGGVVALAGGQPYGVWYPLTLSGGILTLVIGLNFFGIRAAYRRAEMRRLEAEELRRGSAV
jgi:hypothetical protein